MVVKFHHKKFNLTLIDMPNQTILRQPQIYQKTYLCFYLIHLSFLFSFLCCTYTLPRSIPQTCITLIPDFMNGIDRILKPPRPQITNKGIAITEVFRLLTHKVCSLFFICMFLGLKQKSSIYKKKV